MNFNMMEIWQHMGPPAIAIAIILLVMGLASLTVLIERTLALRTSRNASRQFAIAIGDLMRGERIDEVIAQADAPEHAKGHLAKLVRSTLATYRHALTTADAGLPPAERARRHQERALEVISADLRRGLPILASVGSLAPFLGLLGTVLGIVSAFQGIASTGSGGLAAVSAGISEALIETALGIAVAIPAVMAFNYLSTRIGREEQTLGHAGGELIDTIEDWEERRIEGAAASATATGRLDGGARVGARA